MALITLSPWGGKSVNKYSTNWDQRKFYIDQIKCWILMTRKNSRSRIQKRQTKPTYKVESLNRMLDTSEGVKSLVSLATQAHAKAYEAYDTEKSVFTHVISNLVFPPKQRKTFS